MNPKRGDIGNCSSTYLYPLSAQRPGSFTRSEDRTWDASSEGVRVEVFSALCSSNQQRAEPVSGIQESIQLALPASLFGNRSVLSRHLSPQRRSRGGEQTPDCAGVPTPSLLEFPEAGKGLPGEDYLHKTSCHTMSQSQLLILGNPEVVCGADKEEIICNLLFTHKQSVPRGERVSQLPGSHVLF